MYQFPVLIGLVLFGTVMLAFAVYVRARYRHWRSTAIPTTGTVVRIETNRPGQELEEPVDSDGATPKRRPKLPKHVWPVFSYVDATGEPRERRSSSPMRRTGVTVGDEIALFYPADRPYAARFDDGSELKVARVAMVLAALCLPAMVLTFLI